MNHTYNSNFMCVCSSDSNWCVCVCPVCVLGHLKSLIFNSFQLRCTQWRLYSLTIVQSVRYIPERLEH